MDWGEATATLSRRTDGGGRLERCRGRSVRTRASRRYATRWRSGRIRRLWRRCHRLEDRGL